MTSSAQHLHDMPFGAALLADGGARFRLWAPAADRVELCLGEDFQNADGRAMEPGEEGWFDLRLAEARAGMRYFFRVDGELAVPDPASRYQPDDVHAASELIDPRAHAWTDGDWRGRPWEDAVIYELHVGTFTEAGTFRAAIERLAYLRELGVNTVELMPLADFPGRWNWGYDGVLPFAPDSRYGRPEDLKAFVEAAHQLGLSVLIDVVYNHFGPEGNYLHAYAGRFFNERHHTPWGAAINFDADGRRWVRDFFIHNALYWLEEYRFDGLRFDAVHAISAVDESEPDFLHELGERLRDFEARANRPLHLVLENDDNAARLLERDGKGRPRLFSAQWNDDIHHCLHQLLTGEQAGYYQDYADDLPAWIARCLSSGFAYQGEVSPYRDGRRRGEPSGQLPPAAFVSFIQNHDQIGNRAFGERLGELAKPEALRAVTALWLLAPFPPMLFMGQEWGSKRPFLYFCDFGEELADAVREGRRQEFAHFPAFADPAARARIPDPVAEDSFLASKLDWDAAAQGEGRDWLALHKELLALRRELLDGRLRGMKGAQPEPSRLAPDCLLQHWRLGDGSRLSLLANLGPATRRLPGSVSLGECRYATHGLPGQASVLRPWSLYCYFDAWESGG